jgi:exopolyphosphatase/guanosine-5'-triphosphate,3'-diphosphate pyrophosphatase
MKIQADNGACELFISQAWLERNPLTETLLRVEIDAWAALKIHFCIESSSPKKNLS